jgi:hypothetical protein
MPSAATHSGIAKISAFATKAKNYCSSNHDSVLLEFISCGMVMKSLQKHFRMMKYFSQDESIIYTQKCVPR